MNSLMMKHSLPALSLVWVAIAPTFVFAAGGDHGDGIPAVVGWQAINFALYVAILFFVLRKPIRGFFKSRVENYNQALVKAEHAREEAEKKKREIQNQLNVLESTADTSVTNARAEAASLLLQMQQQAKELSEKLKIEANRTVAIEIEKARMELRQDLLDQAAVMAEKMLQDKMAEPDQKRLQTEFVDKIREVHQ